jgi:hypothetical protein
MSLETQVSNIVWFALALVVLWATVRFLVVPAMRDTLRYRLFSIRREMFLFMAKGGISADHVAYGHVRAFLNASIRYADHFSLSRTIAGAMVAGELGKERIKEIEASINALDPDARNTLQDCRQRAASALGLYATLRSPVGWILSLCAIPVLTIVAVFWKPWARIRQSLTRRAEQETELLRCIEEEGALAAA